MAKPPSGEAVPADGLIPTPTTRDTPWSIYLHIPFCTVRCGYCDFNTYTASELRGVTRASFVDDLIAEIEWSAGVLDASGVPRRSASTVFIGGGTPSLLASADIHRILDAVRGVHGMTSDVEITMEANPDTVTEELTAGLVAAGVTRLSIGMQSAVPRILEMLDRTHNPASVATAVAAAKRAGLRSSVDLIYGTPTETLDEWRESLDSAVALETDHVSAYALIVEEGTALERRIRRGELAPIDDDAHADAYELADDLLARAGFEWYEVSNWARDGNSRSRHNLAYWTDADWWGYGPGAHSHLAGTRWWNVKHPAAYAERLAAGVSPGHEREVLTAEQRHDEFVLLGSRLRDGLPLSRLTADERTRVAGLIAEGLVDGHSAIAGSLVLTRNGRLLADLVVRRILD
jgi:oxygen-independent coproporphyrinogen-3 oxidase